MLRLFFQFKPKKKIVKIQSDPHLLSIWKELQEEFFSSEKNLLEYSVSYSQRRQKRVLGSCNITDKKIKIAKELKDPEFHMWLAPLLYHEMCHAVLDRNIPKKNGKRLWHGATFKAIEKRHPKMKEFNSWVKSGGWIKAVRKERGVSAWKKRCRT